MSSSQRGFSQSIENASSASCDIAPGQSESSSQSEQSASGVSPGKSSPYFLSTINEPAFSIRIVTVDYYLDKASTMQMEHIQQWRNLQREKRRKDAADAEQMRVSSIPSPSLSVLHAHSNASLPRAHGSPSPDQVADSAAGFTSQSQPESQLPASEGFSQSSQLGDLKSVSYKVPVLRIFGTTPLGQKVCLHLHGVRPYIFTRPGGIGPWPDPLPTRASLRQTLENRLHAKSISSSSSNKSAKQRRRRYLDGVSWVRGVPFYGYHKDDELFLRIEVFDPAHRVRLREVLTQEMGYDVYESDQPFFMQWLEDNELYPMGFMHLSHFTFRSPLPSIQGSGTDFADKLTFSGWYCKLFHCIEDVEKISPNRVFGENTWDTMKEAFPELIYAHGTMGSAEGSDAKSKPAFGHAGLQNQAGQRVGAFGRDVRTYDVAWPNRQTICELEIDAFMWNIIHAPNPKSQSSPAHAPSVSSSSSLNPFETLNREYAVPSLRALWYEAESRAIQQKSSQQSTKHDQQSGHQSEVKTDLSASKISEQPTLNDVGHEFKIDLENQLKAYIESLKKEQEVQVPISQNMCSHLQASQDLLQEEYFLHECSEEDHEDPSDGYDLDHLIALNQTDLEYTQNELVIKQLRKEEEEREKDDEINVHGHGDNDEAGDTLEDIHAMSQAFSDSDDDMGENIIDDRKYSVENMPDTGQASDYNLSEPAEKSSQRKVAVPHSASELMSIFSSHHSTPQSQNCGNGDQYLRERITGPVQNQYQQQQQNEVLKLTSAEQECDTLIESRESMPLEPTKPHHRKSNRLQQIARDLLKELYDAQPEHAGTGMKLRRVTHAYRLPELPPSHKEVVSRLGMPRKFSIPGSNLDRQESEQGVKVNDSCRVHNKRKYAHAPVKSNLQNRLRGKKMRNRQGLNSGNSLVSQIIVDNAFQATPISSEAGSGGNHLRDLAFSGNIDSAPQNVGMMCLEIFAINLKNPKKMPVADKDPIQMICLVVETDDGNLGAPDNISSSCLNSPSFTSSQKSSSTSSQQSHTPDQSYGSQRRIIIIVDPKNNDDIVDKTAIKKALSDEESLYESSKREFEALAMQCGVELVAVNNEENLLLQLVDIVRGLDPEMLFGWNTTTGSWGYVLRRGSYLGIDMPRGLSRATYWGNDRRCQIPGLDSAESKAASFGMLSWLIWITGRITLQLWSVVRKNPSIKLFRYSLESVAQNVLKHRLHKRSQERLAFDFQRGGLHRWETAQYMLQRVLVALRIFYQLNILGNTAEMARLIGIDFVSVLRRGSQFRVESVMLRITKPRNYVLFRPTPQQIKMQPSLEVQALTREPASGFYPDPVIVLDFQSLYPSIMIAYNLCYSTLIGRLYRYAENGLMHDRVGVRDRFNDRIDPKEVIRLHESGQLYVAPNGAVFVSKKERKGVLAQMLKELLDTRQMIKKEMKSDAVRNGQSKRLSRILDARQMALKLVANVTYGYCSASFSGRMPNSTLADAIVSIGRSALEDAMAFVQSDASQRRWNDIVSMLGGGLDAGAGNIRAEVVYGDTDSLFIRMHGLRSRDIAHDLGKRMADEITMRNPKPIKMKFEYVYHPCILQTKKRYVGLQFERKGEPPTLDAKGIESIRVDQCSLTQKLMDRSLRLLFEPPHDIYRVKKYVQRHWQKLEQGRIPIHEFIFCKEVRLGSYKEGHNPPAAVVAQRLSNTDPGATPLYKERVPFMIAQPHADANYRFRLVEMAISPQTYLQNMSYRVNEPYYIKHTMMALHRLFKICGPGLGFPNKDPQHCADEVNVEHWMAHRERGTNRSSRIRLAARLEDTTGHRTMRHYFASHFCRLCGSRQVSPKSKMLTQGKCMICSRCASLPQQSMGLLLKRGKAAMRSLLQHDKMCEQCSGCSRTPSSRGRQTPCESIDCHVLYARQAAVEKDLEAKNEINDAMSQLSLGW